VHGQKCGGSSATAAASAASPAATSPGGLVDPSSEDALLLVALDLQGKFLAMCIGELAERLLEAIGAGNDGLAQRRDLRIQLHDFRAEVAQLLLMLGADRVQIPVDLANLALQALDPPLNVADLLRLPSGLGEGAHRLA
jgi:hypothetical protein